MSLARLPIVLVVLCVGLSGAGCDDPERRLESAREEVPRALAREDRRAAVRALSDLRGRVPGDAAQIIELGELFIRVGEAPDAVWLFEVGADRFPDDPLMALALAKAALLVQNPSLSLEAARRIDPSGPHGRDALLVEAEAHLGLGDLEAALGALDRARDLDPGHPASHLARVQVLLREGRTDDARAAAEAAITSLDGEVTDFERVLTQIQIVSGEYAPARVWLEQRVAAVPSDLASWQLWLVLGQAQGDLEPVRAAVAAALASDSQNVELEVIRAAAAELDGDSAESDAALERYAEMSGSSLAIVPWAQRLMARGELDRAQAELESWQAERPPNAAVRLISCELALDRNDADGAARCIDAYTDMEDALGVRSDYLGARLLLVRGDAEAATRAFEELVPELDLAPTQYWLGRSLEAVGDLDAAHRRYSLALARDQAWVEPIAALTRLDASRGRWLDAEAAAGRWIQLAPNREDAWALMLQSRLRRFERSGPSARGIDVDESVALAKQAVDRFPDAPRFGVWHAQWLRRAGREDDARPEIERLARAHGDDALVAVEIARFEAIGDHARGLAAARDVAGRFPDLASVHELLAEVAFASGAVEEGDRATARALALAPESVRPLRVRCRFRVSAGRFAEAVDDCTTFLESETHDAEARFWLGVGLAGAGRSDAAVVAYRRAIELDPDDFRPHNNLADLLARSGQVDAALDAAQSAYRLSDGNPYVADTVGWLYLQKGLADRAISLLEEAHRALPEVAEVRLNLARAYVSAGRSEDAQALLDPWLQSEAGRGHVAVGREILGGG